MNGKTSDFNNNFNIYQYFSEITLKQPSILEKTAIIYNNHELNYNELNNLTIKISRRLSVLISKRKFNNGSPSRTIGIHMSPNEYTIPVLLAIHRLQLAYFPMDHQIPMGRIEYIMEDAQPLAIITDSSNLKSIIDRCNNLKLNLIELEVLLNDETEVDYDENSLALGSDWESNTDACILYTSGSTGKPKGVRLTHNTIMNRINWQWLEFEVDLARDIGIFKTSLNFVDHIAEIFAFILKGLPLVVCPPQILKNPDLLINLIHEYRISHIVLVPSLLKAILDFGKGTQEKDVAKKVSSVKRWICSGETLSLSLLVCFFDQIGAQNHSILCNFYGSTEVTADATWVVFESKEHALSLADGTNLPIGRPISNTSVIILDQKSLEPVANSKGASIIGEIVVSGSCLAAGYLNLNNQKLITNDHNFVQLSINNDTSACFRSGDLGYIKNGLIYFSGRSDSQIKVNGKRVDLRELEYVASMPRLSTILSEFIPLIIHSNTIGNESMIIAYYRPQITHVTNLNNDNNDFKSLIESQLSEFLLDYMMPRFLLRLEDETPLLYNGKIDKQALIARFNKLNESTTICSANLDLVKLVEIISNVTGISTHLFKPSSDLTSLSLRELGTNSLNSIEIYLKLKESFTSEFEVTFEDFMMSRNLAELLELIGNKNVATKKLKLKRLNFAEDSNYWHMVLKMFVETFSERGLLCKNYFDKEAMWQVFYDAAEAIKDSSESFIVYNELTRQYVGGALKMEFEKLRLDRNENLKFAEEMLNEIDMSIEKKLVQEGKNVFFGHLSMTCKETMLEENAVIIEFIENEIIEYAIGNGYDTIVTINANKLTTVGLNDFSI